MAQYVLGIDLGTTNSVFSYSPLDAEQPQIELFPIPQLVGTNTVESQTSLPSFLYLASPHESQGGAFDLPWASGREFAVGELGRRQAAEVPDRTVKAAKSWLCYSRVDRRQPILPWNAPEEVAKVSPVTATRRFLEHLVDAWQHAFPDAPVAEQQVVLTVPASFDAAARDLTRDAAIEAGLPGNLLLLEEPQSALYAWLADRGERWRDHLQLDDVLLVCDVGGGTTDLTLVRVAEQNGELVLDRVAVGNHLLVGGDNMDLALAHHAAQMFAQQNLQLDPWQSVSLWHACRAAKETLLARDGPEKHSVSVLGRGSRLIGGTVSVEIDRQAATELLVDGFLPRCEIKDRPERHRASGFQEIGLPFETDAAITRHLAAFLANHADEQGQPAQPTHLLFNGGVFKAETLRQRMGETLADWFGRESVQVLGEHDLDHAVARGAAYYGWSKQHGGVRIRGGTARAYYVGIETAALAVPGAPRPMHALCVVPMGMEEGTELDVESGQVGLVVGETVQFRFFSSNTRKEDQPGDLLTSWAPGDLEETDALEATLPPDEATEDEFVPVRFHCCVNELGVFELWCQSTQTDKRWKLEFSVRDEAQVSS